MTVDGVTRKTGNPFIVIATENPAGSAGTQLLPESQLDRFMICVSMGYPSVKEEVDIMKRNQSGRSTGPVRRVMTAELLLRAQEEVKNLFIHDAVYTYIAAAGKGNQRRRIHCNGAEPKGNRGHGGYG